MIKRFRMREVSKRKFITKTFWSNCWVTLFLLFITRKIVGIRYKKPYHLIGVTKQGNFVHFKTTEQHDRFQPLWFEGRIELLYKRRICTNQLSLETLPSLNLENNLDTLVSLEQIIQN